MAPTFGPGAAALVLSTLWGIVPHCTTLNHTTVPHWCCPHFGDCYFSLRSNSTDTTYPPTVSPAGKWQTSNYLSSKMHALQWLTMEYANTSIHLKAFHPSCGTSIHPQIFIFKCDTSEDSFQKSKCCLKIPTRKIPKYGRGYVMSCFPVLIIFPQLIGENNWKKIGSSTAISGQVRQR